MGKPTTSGQSNIHAWLVQYGSIPMLNDRSRFFKQVLMVTSSIFIGIFKEPPRFPFGALLSVAYFSAQKLGRWTCRQRRWTGRRGAHGGSYHLYGGFHGGIPKWMVYFMENPMNKCMITRGTGYHHFRKLQYIYIYISISISTYIYRSYLIHISILHMN